MDRRLYEAVFREDIQAIHKLIDEDENIVKQTIPDSLHTVLHLAARLGHVELANVIINLFPEMASAENRDLETPLHEACREGKVEIVKLLLENDPWLAYKKNFRDKSVLYVACERGSIEVVKHLLDNFQRLLMLEVDMLTSSLHVAASSGHTEIVKELAEVRPDFAWKKDLNGCSPLHLACSKGHLDITRELLKLDMDLSAIQDNEGRTPLHWAVIKGRMSIIDEILSVSLESAEMITEHGETILHLAVKNNHFEVLKYLMESLNVSNLMNVQDIDGNTVLHLATIRKLTTMVFYLLNLGVEVNALNRRGFTTLDVIEADASNSGALAIIPALLEAGAKRCDQLPPVFQDIQQVVEPQEPCLNLGTWPRKTTACTTFDHSPSSSQHSYNHQRKHSNNSYRTSRAKKITLQGEGLRNARKTITIVAVLIATVTFAAGINPPGGFNQVDGKAILGRSASFKVFLVCNIVALFLSLGIVNVLVSVIPFKRRSMMKLMVATHKVMWISTFFMASAYIAAIWTIMPQGKGAYWVLGEVVVIGAGCTLAVFLSLGILLARQWKRKTEWRNRRDKKKMKEESPKSNTSRVEEMKVMKKDTHEVSSNSDVDSSDLGYHLY